MLQTLPEVPIVPVRKFFESACEAIRCKQILKLASHRRVIVFDRDYPDVMSGEIEGTQDFQFRALGVDRQIIDGLGGDVMAQKIVERDSLDCVPRSALPRNGMQWHADPYPKGP
jgi:hypothetical protein